MLHRPSRPPQPTSLACEPPFRLGALDVEPSIRQVSCTGETQTLEPRVMQVLVALARADGAVVGRDELIERCWDGRIVGENAINRVISRLRHLAATVAEGSFEIETITKVGYRLVVHTAPPREAAAPAPPAALPAAPPGTATRRRLIGAALAVGLGTVAYGSLRALTAEDRDAATARTLVVKGREALRQASSAQDVQAVAYFTEATKLDPDSAEAWGALALAQLRLIYQSSDARHPAIAAWGRSAARRALALDPNEGDARAALILSRPYRGNWTPIEAELRTALRARPGHQPLLAALADLLGNVGRMRESAAVHDGLLSRDRFEPFGQIHFAWALWSAGDLTRAQRVIEDAHRLWPTLESLWSARLCFLAMTGRPDSAIAFANDLDARPLDASRGPPPRYETSVAAARALATRAPADVDAAVAAILAGRARGEVGMPYAAMWLSILGAHDAVFDQLRRYYFGPTWDGGRPLWRWSMFLFVPPVAPLRADLRFAELTRAIGLEDYWRATGTLPDYRR